MAGQSGSSTSALSAYAHGIGKAFVEKYYRLIQRSPQSVQELYTDASKLTRAEAGPDGTIEFVSSKSEIDKKIMSLHKGDLKLEIATIDSQESDMGKLFVMVTGSVYEKLTCKRDFLQSFLLDPMEKGYFVQNDIFRYLDKDQSQTNILSPMLAGGLPVPSHIEILTDAKLSSPTKQEEGEVFVSLREVELTRPEVVVSACLPTKQEEPEVSATLTLEAERLEAQEPADQQEEDRDYACGEDSKCVEVEPVVEKWPPLISVSVSSNAGTSEVDSNISFGPIVSYSSILMKEHGGSSVPLTTYSTKATNLPFDGQAPGVTTGPDKSKGQHFVVDGRSVYVRNLPVNIIASQLEEGFRRFGLIKPGGLTIKGQGQGVCYAFVKFEDIASAQAAIKSSPLPIGGGQVYIEARRPTKQCKS